MTFMYLHLGISTKRTTFESTCGAHNGGFIKTAFLQNQLIALCLDQDGVQPGRNYLLTFHVASSR